MSPAMGKTGVPANLWDSSLSALAISHQLRRLMAERVGYLRRRTGAFLLFEGLCVFGSDSAGKARHFSALAEQ